ncbi:MAG: cysteine synthase A, partial [Proteobacteria bacterium]|nr:cysteine synthase A [Pseudomonadota bacterium]
LAKQMGPGHVIVTVLADYGTRYQSRLFNPAFLREKGLPVPDWLERTGLGS